jgi:hypothetical protein
MVSQHTRDAGIYDGFQCHSQQEYKLLLIPFRGWLRVPYRDVCRRGMPQRSEQRLRQPIR